jgi:mannose-6-phosphate isomerase-like protein (cupin superfamily)
MRKTIWMVLVLACGLAMVVAAWAQGQGQARGQGQGGGQRGPAYQGKPMPPNVPGAAATIIPNGDLETIVKGISTPVGDVAARVLATPTQNVGTYIIHYEPTKGPAEPVRGSYHSEVTEIYVVLRGEGSLLLGGNLENATEQDPNSNGAKTLFGPGAQGVMKGYATRKVAPGDVVVIPPGVPHQTGEVLSKLDLLTIRIDPQKALTLK